MVVAAVEALPSLARLPAGVTRATVGDAEVMVELFTSFGLAMLTGVLCIYIVLVLLFKDFFQPVTILAALPLSIGGAFVYTNNESTAHTVRRRGAWLDIRNWAPV